MSLRIVVVAIAVAAVAVAPAATAQDPGPDRCWILCAPAATPTPTAAPSPAASAAPAPVALPTEVVSKAPRPPLTGGEVAELLSLINAHRRSRGVRPVALDAQLSEIARAHTAVMIAKGLLHHNDSLFTRAAHQLTGIKLFAENVGVGSGVRDNHDGFLNSPAHRANLEGSAYALVGLAVGRSSDGRIWVTENFGTPRIGGTTTVTAPRRTAPRVTAPAPAAPRTTSRTATAATAAKRSIAARVVVATPAPVAAPVAALVDGPEVAVARQQTAAAPARAARIDYRPATASRTVPIGAGVVAALALAAFAVVAPRARRAVADVR